MMGSMIRDESGKKWSEGLPQNVGSVIPNKQDSSEPQCVLSHSELVGWC